METPTADRPLAYAEFHMRGMDGTNAVTTKASTYADINKVVGLLPVNLVFEVHLYCNGIRVGSATYRKQHTYVEIEQESGACVDLLKDSLPPALTRETALP
jgi:hypothetical protein